MNGFGNKIGKITNDITSQFDILADVTPDSVEAEQLEYRIMCGQKFQQDEIDKTKGILTIPRPSYWFNYLENAPKDGDTVATLRHKKLNETIAVQHKPYFMTYNYAKLRREYNDYMRAVKAKCMMQFRMPLDKLLSLGEMTEEQEKFVKYYKRLLPVTTNGHVVNRISEIIEEAFKGKNTDLPQVAFDKNILKSGDGGEIPYYIRKNLDSIYKTYQKLTKQLVASGKEEDLSAICIRQCDSVCPNKSQQADYLIDLLYDKQNSKRFVWMVCGDWIINSMLTAKNGVISYPVAAEEEEAEFYYQGLPYKMAHYNTWEGDYDADSIM